MATAVGNESKTFTGFFGRSVSNDVTVPDTVLCLRLTAGAHLSSRAARRYLSGFASGIQGATPPPGG